MDKIVFKTVLDDDSKIIYISTALTCSEVVRAFYDFMLGCGYHYTNVTDAMALIVEEKTRLEEK